MIINNDCFKAMKELKDNSIDMVLTDPPYGYSFKNESWDKRVPSKEIWTECLRILKDGAFCLVMCAPRQDVLARMLINLEDVGFKMDFTFINWAYASGFGKGTKTDIMIDKIECKKELELKLGRKATAKEFTEYWGNYRGIIGISKNKYQDINVAGGYASEEAKQRKRLNRKVTLPKSELAKKMAGSYLGFQPKPAFEVILVCQKPIKEKSLTQQAIVNGKSVTWFEDCRIPYGKETDKRTANDKTTIRTVESKTFKGIRKKPYIALAYNKKGRLPANLLVSDEVLGEDSRFFSLDAWNKSGAPFLVVPKPSIKERHENCEGLKGMSSFVSDSRGGKMLPTKDTPLRIKEGNFHPTVKPVTLFKYLITMFSRENDIIIDCFAGSGTTGLACAELNRNFIGIEKEKKYFEIMEKRLSKNVEKLF